MPKTGSSANEITIRPAHPADAPALARVMAEAISWGRLRELGHDFVTLLHRHIVGSKYGICYVAERDGVVLGYGAVVTDTAKFYLEFLLRHGFRATVMLLPKIIRLRHWRTIIRGLTYFPEASPDDPRAEVISFAVNPHAKHLGLGKAIFNALSQEFKTRGITLVKVGTVEVTNEAGNAFYRRLGFELLKTAPFYRDSQVNVYVYRVA